ncbi:MarR family winged helix-turn-helix transcriptional regulator [Williamsia limnetica]|uniref:MarR family winged helix-turn-helix transcriptional regulator n=1 Tax=Williamsia limnetica TaxID=882452 RepID=UPI000D7B93BF|nr:MarR family transcriptional regulator [Williamsia limnetica]
MPARRGPLPIDPIAEAHRQWVRQGWYEVADGMAAITSVMRVQQIMLSRIEDVLKPYKLSFARYELLALLMFSKTGLLPMAKIGERLQVHPTSVTNVVDRLESAAFVERVPHPTDRRATLIQITQVGRDVVASATDELNRRVFPDIGLTSSELSELNAILGKYRFLAGDFIEDAPQAPWAVAPQA